MTKNHPESEPVQAQKTKNKSGRHTHSVWFKPGLLQAAVVLFWASVHVPSRFNPVDIGIWVLSAVTVALVAKSISILALPIGKIIVVFLQQQLKNSPNGEAGS